MMAWLIISLVVVVGVFLLIFFLGASSSSQPPENIAGLVDWDVIADDELQSYLPNQKINAIKRYRELTSVGLKEAKEAVEYAMENPEGRKKARVSHKAVDTDGAGVRDLIEAGQIEKAIDVYASFMGIDEYSARDAIEEMQREMNLDDLAYESDSSNDYFDLGSGDSSYDSSDD